MAHGLLISWLTLRGWALGETNSKPKPSGFGEPHINSLTHSHLVNPKLLV